MRSGIYAYNRRQPTEFVESQPSTQTECIFTPKRNFLTSRFFIDVNWNLSGASLTAFQSMLTAQGFSTTAASNLQTANGRLQAIAMLANTNFRTTFLNAITVNMLLKGQAPLKNQITATDCMLRDTIYCGVQPLIEWNNGTVGQLRIGFWVHMERPFMNESATLFTVENQNSMRLSLPTLILGSGSPNSVNLYAARSVVEQKYLYFEAGVTANLIAPYAVFNVDERDIHEVYMYEPANIVENVLFQTFLNGREVDSVLPSFLRYNALLDTDNYPIAAGLYTTTPDIVAPRSIELGFHKIFQHPVLNLPPTSNKNRNFRAQFNLTTNTNVRFYFSKILETDATKMETENYVQTMQGSYSR